MSMINENTLNKYFNTNQSIKSEKHTAVEIHNKLYRNFPFPGQSRSNNTDSYFKAKNGEKFLAKYDEPTYLTFRVNFITQDYDTKNKSEWGGFTQYDDMPHPLLIKSNLVRTAANNTIKDYSSSDYLKNSLGEEYRAELLEEFITGLTDITLKYPYYFTSIEGLSELFKVDPTINRRVKPGTVITINCMEALDLRITQLLNLYRKVAWDDVYQRWILPDMMRFFKMEIYISEMRIFHTTKATKYESTETSSFNLSNNLVNTVDDTSKFITLAGDALNEIMPTIKLELSQCEFDMSDSMSYLNTLKSSKHNDAPQPKIKIKVGNVVETHIYGLNRDVDKLITEANNTGKYNVANLENTFYKDFISDNVLVTSYNSDNSENYLKNVVKGEITSIEGGLDKGTAISSSSVRRGISAFDSENDSYKKNWEQNTASGVLGNLSKNVINEQLSNANNIVAKTTSDVRAKLQDSIGHSDLGNKLSSAARALGYNTLATTSSLLNTFRSSIYSNTALKEIVQMVDTAANLPNELLRIGLNELYKLARIEHTDNTPVMREIQYMLNNNMTGDEMSKHIDDLINKDALDNMDKPEFKNVGEPVDNYTPKTSIDKFIDKNDLIDYKNTTINPLTNPADNYVKTNNINDIIDKNTINNLQKPNLRDVGEPSDTYVNPNKIDDIISDDVLNKRSDKTLTPVDNMSPEYTKGTDIDDLISKDKLNNTTKPELHPVPKPNTNYKSRGLINPKYIK